MTFFSLTRGFGINYKKISSLSVIHILTYQTNITVSDANVKMILFQKDLFYIGISFIVV